MTHFPPNDSPSGGWPQNPAQAGWQPDPTGRHQHRYWDGVQWTDHVADGGAESVDPFAGVAQGGPPGYGPMGGGGDPYGGGPGGPPTGPQRPPRSGPSPALLVAIGVVLIAVVVGVAVVLTSSDDDGGDETSTDTTEQTSDTTAGDGSTTTTAGGTDDTSENALVGLLATGMLEASNGALNEEQANCIAEQMFDTLGTERIIELGQDPSGNAFNAMTSEEQQAVAGALLECVDAETLAEIGGGTGTTGG